MPRKKSQPTRKTVPPEFAQLAKLVGEFMELWGFKRVHGQIWTHLFLSDEALDAAALIARLKISKALVSLTLKDLLEYEVIEPAGKGPQKTIVYRANPKVMEAILNVLRSRERLLLARTKAAFRAAEKANLPLNSERLQDFGQLLELAEQLLEAFIASRALDLGAWQRFQA